MRAWRVVLVFTLVGLSGCASQPVPQAINVQAISKVQAELKRQVGIYVAEVSQNRTTKAALRAAAATTTADSPAPPEYWCGKGDIDFDITSVKLDLLTSLDRNTSISASATVPIAAGESVTPSVSAGHDVSNTEELTFTEYALPADMQPNEVANQHITQEELDSAPIAKTLLALRDALIASARRSPDGSVGPQPCFIGQQPSKPSGHRGSADDGAPSGNGGAQSSNTFKLGLTVTDSGSAGLTLRLGVLNLGDTSSAKAVFGNTVTVGFAQVGANPVAQWFVACKSDNSQLCLPDGKTPFNGVGMMKKDDTNTSLEVVPPASDANPHPPAKRTND